MRLLKLFRQEVAEPVRLKPSQVNIREQVIVRHKKIISNLEDEFETLAHELRATETAEDISRADRESTADRIIARMRLLKCEIVIREELLKCL